VEDSNAKGRWRVYETGKTGGTFRRTRRERGGGEKKGKGIKVTYHRFRGAKSAPGRRNWTRQLGVPTRGKRWCGKNRERSNGGFDPHESSALGNGQWILQVGRSVSPGTR